MIHERAARARLAKSAARSGFLTSCAALLVLGLGVGAQAKPVITSFDPAGSIGTQAVGINAGGVIAGDYNDSNSVVHGYVRAADGTITAFDPKGSTQTVAFGINAKGVIAGEYLDPNRQGPQGFVRAANGKIRVFAGAATCINDGGTTAGWVEQGGGTHGFVRSAGGAITVFDVSANDLATYANAINKSGTVTGSWLDSNQVPHGFYRTASGAITTFDPPNAVSSTNATGIDGAGAITGYFADANGQHGYVRAVDGTYTIFDPTGTFATYAGGINTKGVVVGNYWTGPEGNSAGYVRAPGGKITSISVEGSGYTFGTAINGPGDITGYYYGADDLYHGFLRTP